MKTTMETWQWLIPFIFLIILYVFEYYILLKWIIRSKKPYPIIRDNNRINNRIGYNALFCGLIAVFLYLPAKHIIGLNAAVPLSSITNLIPCLTVLILVIFKRNNFLLLWITLNMLMSVPFDLFLFYQLKGDNKIDFFNQDSLVMFLVIFFLILSLIFYLLTQVNADEQKRLFIDHIGDYEHGSLSKFRNPYEKFVMEEISSSINNLDKKISVIANNNGNDQLNYHQTDDFDIIKVLEHFFSTPFATIEASVELLKESVKDGSSQLEVIRNSVNLCRGVMATYRNSLSYVGEPEKVIKSLKLALSIAFSSFSKEIGKSFLPLNTDTIPEQLMAYPNHYIISIILPLLENAIQAAPSNTEIEIVFDTKNGTICIKNLCEKVPDLTDLNTYGYSSKEDHKGMGIMIVRNLLSIKSRGQLVTAIENNRVCQTIILKKHEN